MKTLCEVLEERHLADDLETMMHTVSSRIATNYETSSYRAEADKRHIIPSMESTLRKKVYFWNKSAINS